MKIDKNELSQKISKLKGIVMKKAFNPVMESILLENGYLIGSNQEITIKAKLESVDEESFLIPAKAFDLIHNLPGGELEISSDKKFKITIRSGKTKAVFQSMDPKLFNTGFRQKENETSITLDMQELKKCMNHVLYSVAQQNPNATMCTMCLDCNEGYLNFVGLDGHMLAWDKLPFDGTFTLLIPRTAVEKMLSLDITGSVQITYTKTSAVFRTDEYVIDTRLVDGEYFKYPQMFRPMDLKATVNRKEFIDAVNRAALCTEVKEPICINFTENNMRIYLSGRIAKYSEDVPLESGFEESLNIAFDSKLLINTLKTFSSDIVTVYLMNAKYPMMIESDDCELKSIVLPVKIN